MDSVVVRLQTADGQWEVAGTDRKTGIIPQHVKYAADASGSSSASFDLRRDPGVLWPDLAPFTPVEIEINGTLVWSGRTKETPTRETFNEAVINVQCEGWQFHLDDDVMRLYNVQTKVNDWIDVRTHPRSSLGDYTSDLYVSQEGGKWTIGGQNGTVWRTGKEVGILLDLGPSMRAGYAIVNAYRTAGSPSTVQLYVRGTNDPANLNAAGFTSDAVTTAALNTFTTSTSGTYYTGAFGTKYRYVCIFLYNSGGDYTVAAPDGNGDVAILNSIVLTPDSTFVSGNEGFTLASSVLNQSKAYTPLLDQSSDADSLITTTSFHIPSFTVFDAKTPREVQDAANSFHDYVRKVNVNRQLTYTAKPATASLCVGDDPGVEIEDASANSTEDMYSRVLVTGQDAAGLPVFATGSGGSSDVIYQYVAASELTVPNPSADVDATNWFTTSGTITRDTSIFGTTPASIKLNTPGGSPVLYTPLVGLFRAGVTYRLTVYCRRDGGSFSTGTSAVIIDFGDTTEPDLGSGAVITAVGPNQWSGVNYVYWTPTTTVLSSLSGPVYLRITGGSAITNLWADTVSIDRVLAGPISRRGFIRTKVLPLEFPCTPASAQQIADTYAADHLRTQFKGTVTIHGGRSVSKITSGDVVPVYQLPLYTQELFRLNNRIDPDSGGVGRDGRIAAVEVDVDTQTAQVALDNTRNNFEAYLARLALVTNTKLGG